VNFKTFVKRDPREAVDYAFRQQVEAGWKNADCWYIPDAGGMGQGLMHCFHESGKNTLEFHSEGTAVDSEAFADAISEAWWGLRALVQEHVVHLPDSPRLLKQLSSRQYYTDRRGRIKIETKDEWRKRTGAEESPDQADCVVMLFYQAAGRGFRIAHSGPQRSR